MNQLAYFKVVVFHAEQHGWVGFCVGKHGRAIEFCLLGVCIYWGICKHSLPMLI